MRTMEQMQSSGISPNVVTYTALVEGLCGEGRVEESVRVVKDMAAAGVDPNQRTYNGGYVPRAHAHVCVCVFATCSPEICLGCCFERDGSCQLTVVCAPFAHAYVRPFASAGAVRMSCVLPMCAGI